MNMAFYEPVVSASESEADDDRLENELSRSPSPIQRTHSPSNVNLEPKHYVTGEEDWQRHKTRTLGFNLKASQIPLWAKFLSNRCIVKGRLHEADVYEISILTNELKEWLPSSDCSSYVGNISNITLGSKLTALTRDTHMTGVSKRTVKRDGQTQQWYRFDWTLLKTYLTSKQLFVETNTTALTTDLHDDIPSDNANTPLRHFDQMSETASVQGQEDREGRISVDMNISPIGEDADHEHDDEDEDEGEDGNEDDDDDVMTDGDSNELEDQSRPNQMEGKNGRGTPQMKCWLCTFSNTQMALDMTEFITQNIHRMDLFYISSQVRNAILQKYPSAKGARKREITRHISRHMIVGNVRMATNIHSLTNLAENLRSSMYQRDPETNELVIDTKISDQYLKVITQITQIYKCDTKRLLF